MGEPARLQKIYTDEVRTKLKSEYNYANVMQIPGLTKVVVNMGVGEAAQEPKAIESAVAELTQITGRKPSICKARKSVANFKLREGQPIGAKVTLRREAMWHFLDRLMNVALPRVRDFRGVSNKGFDGQRNYTLSVREQIIFPEIDYDKIDKIKGMNVTVVTTANSDEEAMSLLSHLGMPFRK